MVVAENVLLTLLCAQIIVLLAQYALTRGTDTTSRHAFAVDRAVYLNTLKGIERALCRSF
jgi:hypothetical protein